MDISETVEVKGYEKCIFETPHNDMKCVSSIKESTVIAKMGQRFPLDYVQG